MKEKEMYEEEVLKKQAEIERMLEQGRDEHDVNKQVFRPPPFPLPKSPHFAHMAAA